MATGRPGIKLAHRLDDPDKKRTADVVNQQNQDKTFHDLHLKEQVLEGVLSAGFKRPSPIQWAALPLAKIGLDLVVQSKSGTGKTLVYAVSILSMVNVDHNSVQALVICPTREIAVQGARTILDVGMAAMPDVRVSTLIGGMSVADDAVKLTRCHVVVGTPGRIKQMADEGHLKTGSVRMFCLDEADKMMEKAFKNDVTSVYNRLPSAKQVIALSATYTPELAGMLAGLMRSPHHVRLGENSQVLVGLEHYVIRTAFHPRPKFQMDFKFKCLLNVLNSVTFSQCLVFTNYALSAEAVCERLEANGWPAVYIAAALDQEQRLRVMSSLKQFNTRILVTTDLSARGIDASNVTLVVHYDVPWESTTFLHRCGRAGRFGSRGVNVSLASQGEEEDSLRKIVYRTGTEVRVLDPADIPDLWKLKGPPESLQLLEGLSCPEGEPERGYQKQQKPKKKSDEEEDWTQQPSEADPAPDHFEEEYCDDYGHHDTFEEELRDYTTGSDDADYGYDDDVESSLLPDDFIVQSFAAITGMETGKQNVMTYHQAKTVVSDLIKSSQKVKPFDGFLKSPTMEELTRLADKAEKHQTALSGGWEAVRQDPAAASDFKDELEFVDQLMAGASSSSGNEQIDKETVAQAIRVIQHEQSSQFEAKVENVRRQLEKSKLTLQEAVDYAVQNGGQMPDDVMGDVTPPAQIAQSESSSISPHSTPIKRVPVQVKHEYDEVEVKQELEEHSQDPPLGQGLFLDASNETHTLERQKSRDRIFRGRFREDGRHLSRVEKRSCHLSLGLGAWVPVREEDSVLDRQPPAQPLYQREVFQQDDPVFHGNVFPDPDEGLGDFLDTDDPTVLLRRQFDEWWAKIQANKSLIRQHEFNKHMALAELKYGRKFQ